MQAAGSARTLTELVAAAGAGDQRSWGEIVDRYGGMVRAVAASFRLTEADAADAAQNTWLRAVERLHTVREPERFGGWLKTTARRECLALTSGARREQPDDTFTEHLVETAPGPETLFLRAEASAAVRTAVDGLTGRRRRLVDALFYQPVGDYAVASRTAGMPVGSIGPTRARILQVLRCDLEQSGFGPAEPRAPRPGPAPRRAVPVG
jgi:RNA polymerase sigma factor (sigma-70 family)